jgi:hypothetical protein
LTDEEIKEVEDFIDFIVHKNGTVTNESDWTSETQKLVETGMESYLNELEEYEEKLARGDIKW